MVEDEHDDRRAHLRVVTELRVDVRSDEHFLFAHITNISEMGIFIRSDEPLPIGTELQVRFGGEVSAQSDVALFELEGVVVWVNPVRPGGPNPGMGVHFPDLTPEERERLVELVRAIAYLD